MTTTASSTGARPERTIAIIGGLIVLLVALAIGAALTLGNRPTPDYPPGTPEAALQGYTRAVAEGDTERAYRSFSAAVQRQMSLDQYQKEFGPRSGMDTSDTRLRIDRVEIVGERATLHVTTERFHGGGLSSGRSAWTNEVRLVREAGEWRIDQRVVWLG